MIGEWNYDGCHAWHACMHLLLLPSSLDDLAKSRKDERDIDCVPKCTWFGDENMNEIKRNCLVNCMRFARGERRGAAPSMQARTLSRCLLACAHTTKLLSGAALRFLQLRAEFERPSSRTGGNVRIERNSAATLCTFPASSIFDASSLSRSTVAGAAPRVDGRFGARTRREPPREALGPRHLRHLHRRCGRRAVRRPSRAGNPLPAAGLDERHAGGQAERFRRPARGGRQ